MDNPLLDFTGLPRFSEIRPEHVTPAVDALLAAARQSVANAVASPAAPTWQGFVEPMQDASERLSRAWSQVNHLQAVVNTPELREAYHANLPKLVEFWTEVGQNEALYTKYRQLSQASEFVRLDAAQRRLVANTLRDFRLSGAELGATDKARFKAVEEEIASLGSKFDDNVLDSTDAWSHFVDDRAELAGVPDDTMAMYAEQAQADGRSGWKLTLKGPSYTPIMQYCGNRALREKLYRASATRASELGKPEWDNTAIMRRLLVLRREAARLLGFANYAELSLEPKMADTPAEVFAFLRDLARRAKPYAERDMAELRAFARSELGIDRLESWDLLWASEKLRERRYAFSDNEVKQYLPEDVVVPGMFRVVETLYGVEIRPSTAPNWHPSVRFYDVHATGGAVIGRFYLDLYARNSKRGGAWMDEAITRRRKGNAVQIPVAYLTCNFSEPTAGKPATFTHDEVLTLFHEFGHGLHLLLTQVDTLGVSGINGVEWDAVELPSQFMENFCWEWEVLRTMTRHADSGGPLPRTLYDKMLAAKNFQSGMQTVRQLEFALFDMRLHTDFDPEGAMSILDVLAEVRREVAVVFPPEYQRLPHTFGHIFGGGYAAGYYSYKWAEVLSADAYSLFEEQGVLSPVAGARFRDEVLARGGSRPALESFVAFRGRAPKIDALLRHNGMVETV